MTEKRYIYASVGVSFEILDSWFGYTGDDEPTEREIEEYDFLVIGIAPDKDAAEGICRRLNDQQDEINHLSNFGLHVILDKKNKEIEELKQFKEKVVVLLDEKIKHYEHKPFSAPISNPANPNYDADVDRLARLSELQQLKEELRR